MAIEDSLRDCRGVLTVARRLPVGNKPGCTLHRLNRLRAATSANAALLKSIGIVCSFPHPAIIVLYRPRCNHESWAGADTGGCAGAGSRAEGKPRDKRCVD